MREPDRRDGVGRGEDRRARLSAEAAAAAPRLYRLAWHLCGDPLEAEDLVHDVLVKAIPALSAFEGRAALSTYLSRALSNHWKNRLRTRARSKTDPWPEGSEMPGREPGPLESLERAERAGRVRRAMFALDPDRRMTLVLREVEGLAYEEIAEATGVPVGTVRSRLARAREQLRAVLEGQP